MSEITVTSLLAEIRQWQQEHDEKHGDLRERLARIETVLEEAGSPVKQAQRITRIESGLAHLKLAVELGGAALLAGTSGAVPWVFHTLIVSALKGSQ